MRVRFVDLYLARAVRVGDGGGGYHFPSPARPVPTRVSSQTGNGAARQSRAVYAHALRLTNVHHARQKGAMTGRVGYYRV